MTPAEWLPPPRAVLFDLDGTLAHTLPDIIESLNAARREHGLPPSTDEEVASWVGNGARRLCARSLGTEDDTAAGVEELLAALGRWYLEVSGTRSSLYAGIREMISGLRNRGIPVACTTNKPRYATDLFLERKGADVLFDTVVTPDDVGGLLKPDPANLLEAARLLGVPPVDCLVVGDSLADFHGARAAGMRVILFLGGYGDPDTLRKAGADATVETIAEVTALLS